MKWFKKAAPVAARPALARGFATWAGGEVPRRYEDQVRDGFVANPVARRAVKLIAEGVAGVPLNCSHAEIEQLISARSAGQELLETVAMQVLLHGNAFVQVLGGGPPRVAGGDSPLPLAGGETGLELFALRPERVTVERDARGWPTAYLYRVGDSVSRIAGEDGQGRAAVIHLKAAHPLDDHYGLSCLGAAAGAVALHNAATRWNRALLDNAARPSGALVFEGGDGVLSADQFDRLRRELDGEFSGLGNAGRPMLLEGGLKWQAMSMTPADMDFVGLKSAAAREIALAFGVPPMLLGLPGDAAYANYREANRALWRLAILPLANAILGGLADGLKGWFPDCTLSVNLDRVPALSEERERLWAQVTAADFLRPEEKRALLGLDA